MNIKSLINYSTEHCKCLFCHSLGLFDMQHFQFFLKGDELELGTKLRRVYFATEFVFDTGNPMSNSADSFVQIHTKGTIYGDVAIQVC